MAQISNKYSLPDTIYQAVKNNFHITAGDISVTQLIDAPQIRILKKLHRDELQEDVSDMVASLLGSSVHAILEQANHSNRIQKSFDDVKNYFINKKNEAGTKEEGENILQKIKQIDSIVDSEFPNKPTDKYIFEKTLHVEVDGMVISGTFDLLNTETHTLQDYKTCSTFAYMYPESKMSWTKQINIYAYMLRVNGYKVDNASVVAIFKDFSKSKIVTNKDYPKQPVVEIPITLYGHDKIGEYIRERVRLHKAAEAGNVPECTSKERWGKADMYAIMVKNAKRALRVVETKIAAEKFIELNKEAYEGLTIEHRPGENKRCNEFCSVAQFCKQNLKNLNK